MRRIPARKLNGGEVILLDPLKPNGPTADVGAVSKSEHTSKVFLMLLQDGTFMEAELDANQPVSVVA